MTGKTFYIETYGCQMNVHDSERMAGLLEEAGYEPTALDTDADVIVINTCSVRDLAEQKALRKMSNLRALRKKNPGVVLGFLGCMAQRRGASLRPWPLSPCERASIMSASPNPL